MSNSPRLILTLLTALLVFSILTPRVFASDDSNQTGLTPTTNTAGASPTTSQIISAINQFLKEANSTQNYNNSTQAYNNATQNPEYRQFLQLLKQFENQAQSGNNVGAANTLTQIKQQLQTQQMQDFLKTQQGNMLIPPSLRALLSSMSPASNGNGFTVDPTSLENILGSFNSQGLVSGLTGESPFQQASDMQTMGSLMSNIDPATGSNLLQDSSLLNGEIGSGLFGAIPPGFGAPGELGGTGIGSIPNMGNLPGASTGQSSFGGVPSIPKLASSVPGTPSIPRTFGLPTLPLIIVAIAGAAVLLFMFRKRFGVLGRRVTPTTLKMKPLKPEIGLNLQNPRDLIIYYFRKVVGSMSKRGIPRLDPDTHREFSSKCSPRPEAPPVKNISVLYEKALFSGREVTMPEADNAKEYAVQVEQTTPQGEKRRFGFRSSRDKTPQIG